MDSNIWIIGLAYFFVIWPASWIMKGLLSVWLPKPEQAEQSLENAGKIIGYLERVIILTFVLAGEYAGVGFVLAAKSIFRFGEINSNAVQRTEYFIIGTLLSIAVALLTGVITSEFVT